MIYMIIYLIFDALGVWLIILSRKKAKLIEHFREYVTVISHDGDGFIPDIAASLGVPECIVEKNLEIMIKKRFFSNAFIDRNANSIVIVNKQAVSTMRPAYHAVPPAMIVTVKCKGCGGVKMMVKGTIGECDYCGSIIKGE